MEKYTTNTIVHTKVFYLLLSFKTSSTYKHHLFAWKNTQQMPQFIQKCCVFCSILSFKTLEFIRFKDPSLHSIDLTSCCILGEKRIIFCLALCSEGVFSLRTKPYMPQLRLFLILFSHLQFYLMLLLLVIRIGWLDLPLGCKTIG